MKFLTVLILAMAPAFAQACPPTNGHPAAEAERQRVYREYIERADAIVYASASSGIREGRGGTIRILHVYRGDLQAGQRVRLRFVPGPFGCPVYITPGTVMFPRGGYGVLLLFADDERESFTSIGFLDSVGAEQLIREGFIDSARGSSAGPVH